MAISSAALYLPTTSKLSPSISLSSSTSSFISASSKFVGNRVALTQTLPGNERRKRFSCTCLFGLGVPELAVIAGVAALVFGPKKLPEIGRSIGKTVKSFQQAAQEFESELKKEPESLDEATGTTKPTAAREGEKESSDPISATKESL